jgi:hypothetical protein
MRSVDLDPDPKPEELSILSEGIEALMELERLYYRSQQK